MRRPATFNVKIRGSARGLPDREFVVVVDQSKGITVRTKGSSATRTVTWKQLMAYVLLHYGEL